MTHSVQLPKLLRGLTNSPVPNIEITGICLDSRRVQSGDVFLAFQGGQQHGLDYVAQAIANGAAAIVWDGHPEHAERINLANIHVANLASKAGKIASRFWGEPSKAMNITGFTGTDGKTTCAYLLAQALTAIQLKCGYIGTLGHGYIGHYQASQLTTPAAPVLQSWLAELEQTGAKAVALEASSHALDQSRLAGVSFDTAVLTYVGRDHLDYHKTIEQYAQAKQRLFQWPNLRHAVLNADDEYGRQWLKQLAPTVQAIVYGQQPQTAQIAAEQAAQYIWLTKVEAKAQGLLINLQTSWGNAQIHSQLIGEFNAMNLAAVLAVLLTNQIELDTAAKVLNQLQPVPGRMEVVSTQPKKPLVIVDFAHTPNALKQALLAVRAHAQGRVICVFGCGGDRDQGKRPIMGQQAAALAEHLIITSDNPRSEDPQAIIADIVSGIDQDAASYEVIADRTAAIQQAIKQAKAGDAVLIAGKGHETQQQIGTLFKDHDDRIVARQALEAVA